MIHKPQCSSSHFKVSYLWHESSFYDEVKELWTERFDFLHSKNWIHLLRYVTQSCPTCHFGSIEIFHTMLQKILFFLFSLERKITFSFTLSKKFIENVTTQFQNLPSLIPFHRPPFPLSSIPLHSPSPPTAHGTHTVHKYTSTQGEVPPSGFVSDICFGSRFYFKFLLLKEEMHEGSHALRRAYQSKFNWDVES